MRVQIADYSTFAGLQGRAEAAMKINGYWVWLDILPGYPMQFSASEVVRIDPTPPNPGAKQ